MKVSKHPLYFLFVKLSQLLVCIIIIILEATSYFAWNSYVDEINSSTTYPRLKASTYFDKQVLQSDPSITYNGQVKIWYYIVISITFVGTVAYVSRYKWLWDHALRLILMELFFFSLWFSAGIANFDPWYSGPGLRCELIRTDYTSPVITKLAELAQLQCTTDVASISFGWINVGLYVVSLYLARKRSSELNWTNMPSNNSDDPDIALDSRTNMRSSRNFFSSSNRRPVFF